MRCKTRRHRFGVMLSAMAAVAWIAMAGLAGRPAAAQATASPADEVLSLAARNWSVDPDLLAAALDQMTEEQLLALAERFWFTVRLDSEAMTLERLCQRFPSSSHVPKARFDLAVIDVLTHGNWQQSAAMFEEVARAYPGSGYDREALRYRSAISDPRTVDDLEVLQYIFYKSRFHLGGMVSMDFAALAQADMAKRGIVDVVLASDRSVERKGEMLYGLAYAIVWANRPAHARKIFETVLAHNEFEADPELVALTHRMLGYLLGFILYDVDGGLVQLQVVLDRYPQTTVADDALLQMAELQMFKGDFLGAYFTYRRLLVLYPSSLSAQRAMRRLEVLPMVLTRTKPATGAFTRVAAAVAGDSFRSIVQQGRKWMAPKEPAVGQATDVALLRTKASGAVAVREVCRQLGVAMSAEESAALCKIDPLGTTNFKNMAEALSSKALRVEAREIGLRELRLLAQAQTPVIMHFERSDRFAVLKAIRGETAVVADPHGEYSLSLEQLAHEWNGYVLIARRPGDAPPTLTAGDFFADETGRARGKTVLAAAFQSRNRLIEDDATLALIRDRSRKGCWAHGPKDPRCPDCDGCCGDAANDGGGGGAGGGYGGGDTHGLQYLDRLRTSPEGVILANGDSNVHETDAVVSVKGLSIPASRSYCSNWLNPNYEGDNHTLGEFKWSMSWDKRLDWPTTYSIYRIFTDERGVRILFEADYEMTSPPAQSQSRWVSHSTLGVYALLIQTPPSTGAYCLTTADGLEMQFDPSSGRILSEKTPQGHQINYTYDGQAHLASITDAAGSRGLAMTYYPNCNRLKRVQDIGGTLGYWVDYEYTTQSCYRLSKVLRKTSTPTTTVLSFTEYFYENSSHTLTLIKHNGRPWRSFSYEAGLVSSVRNSGNTLLTSAITGTASPQFTRYYNDTTSETRHFAVLCTGDVSTMTIPRGAGLIRKSYAFDLPYNPRRNTAVQADVWTTGPVAVTDTREYDSAPFGENYPNCYWDWLRNKNLLKFVDGGMNMLYGPGKQTTYQYETLPLVYRLLKINHPDGTTTKMERYNNGTVKKVTSRGGTVTTYTVDQTYGWVTAQAIDPGGLNIMTQYVYDNATGWVKKVISCGSCSGAGTTEYERDSRGNVVRQRSGGASDPWTQFYYDEQSRLTRVDSPFADGGSTATTYFSYDAWSNRIRVTDPANKATSFSYDTENRLSRVRDAANGLTSYNYDRQGNLTAVTDANLNATVYSYDDLGRLVQETPPPPVPWFPSCGWQYEYANTIGGELVRVRKPDHYDYSQVPFRGAYVDIAYTYDVMGRVTFTSGPIGQFAFYGYDINSQLTGGLDPNFGTWLSGTDYVTTWDFGYDADGRMTVESLKGQTYGTTATYPLGRREVQYDKAGRRTKQAFKSANRTGYLNLDTTQTYGYDSDKKWLKSIARQGSANECTTYTYDSANGRLTRMDYGNGAHTDYTYYGSGALKKISHLSTTGTLIASAEYDYDLAGNVLTVVLDDSLTYPGDATVSYTYDDLHRLTEETCVPAQGSYRWGYDCRYTYDAVGNRTCKIEPAGSRRYETYYSYSARNELVSLERYEIVPEWNDETQEWEEVWYYQDGYSYGYDLRGNLISKADAPEYPWWYWNYTWSADDKLTKAEYWVFDGYYDYILQTTVEYKYDLLGRRVAKRLTAGYGTPGPWRWYFYDGLQVTAEGTGQNDKMYYTTDGSVIGGIIARDNNGMKYWYHYDRLGNVMAITDSNGNPYAVYTMEAFGNVFQVGTSTGYYSSQSDPQPYHLTTKEYDPDTGLYYFNARWYDPTTGRFLGRAKFRPSEEHRYLLCQSNPLGCVDATGLFPIRIEWTIGGCMSRIANEVQAEYETGRPNDWFAHCLVSCRARQECCYPWMIGCGAIIQGYGLCHEVIGGWETGHSGGDCKANQNGVICAWSREGCEACCGKIYCHKRK